MQVNIFSFTQFYQTEHAIVDKYSEMIAEEVKQYKNEMLDYFHAREIQTNDDESLTLPNANPRLYTTSIARTTYEIDDLYKDDAENLSENQFEEPTFLTEDQATTDAVPFIKSFRIPSNLVQSIMFKYFLVFQKEKQILSLSLS